MSPRPFAIIVPTKDRPQELRRFLRSIEQQPVKPDQLIVVDGSDRPIQSALSDFRHLGIEYIPVRPPGLVKQRHAGVAALQAEIEVFGFFDDDIVLEPGALPAIQEFWEGRWDQYGGFGMNIVNAADVTYRKHLWYLRFFKIRDDRFPGAILPSCRSVPYSPTDRNRETQWLCGGATFWKREIFREMNYDHWFKGWGMSDDLEFSIRVGKKYRMAVAAAAKVQHLETATRRGKHFLRGYIGATNTMRIAKIHPQFSVGWAGWSWLGQGLARVGHGIATFDFGEALLGFGHLAAVLVGWTIGFRSLETQVKN